MKNALVFFAKDQVHHHWLIQPTSFHVHSTISCFIISIYFILEITPTHTVEHTTSQIYLANVFFKCFYPCIFYNAVPRSIGMYPVIAPVFDRRIFEHFIEPFLQRNKNSIILISNSFGNLCKLFNAADICIGILHCHAYLHFKSVGTFNNSFITTPLLPPPVNMFPRYL